MNCPADSCAIKARVRARLPGWNPLMPFDVSFRQRCVGQKKQPGGKPARPELRFCDRTRKRRLKAKIQSKATVISHRKERHPTMAADRTRAGTATGVEGDTHSHAPELFARALGPAR